MEVLLKFTHGLGDAVQLTCILLHLALYRPDWVVDVATQIGKHTAYSGLCRHSFILERDPIDEGHYDRVYDLGWYECYSVYSDSPCTKSCNCLREEFGIVPDLALLKYQITISDASRRRTRDYLKSICDGKLQGRDGTSWRTAAGVPPDVDGTHAIRNGYQSDCTSLDESPPIGDRLPVVAIHYQANTSQWKKDLPHELVAGLCQEILNLGHIPLILDWDRRSPLPDQKSIFCPGVGPGDLWDNTGTGDAERLVALLSQCALVIGVDSGPLHVAGATQTPTLGVWTGHHPVQFYDLCPNVTHLVPASWCTIPPCQNQPAAQFFEEHYAYREYRDLRETLLAVTRSMLARCQRKVLLQSATGTNATLLSLTRERHARFAKQHGYEYRVSSEDLPDRSPHWQKIQLLREVLGCPDVELAVWLDADAVIADDSADFTDALGSHDLAMWKCLERDQPIHFNSGVIVARRSPRTQQFLDEVWEAGESEHRWREQYRINEVAGRPKWLGFIRSIGPEWNSTWRVSEVVHPKVVAFHGEWGAPLKAELIACFLVHGLSPHSSGAWSAQHAALDLSGPQFFRSSPLVAEGKFLPPAALSPPFPV